MISAGFVAFIQGAYKTSGFFAISLGFFGVNAMSCDYQNSATDKVHVDEKAKVEASKRLEESWKALEAYDDSESLDANKDKERLTQAVADAQADVVRVKGMYATAEAAQEVGQLTVDYIRDFLDGVEKGFSDVPKQAVVTFFKGISRFFESLLNDPSLNADLRVQAGEAYRTVVKEWLDFHFWDLTNEDKYGALSLQSLEIQDLKNGFTLIEDLNTIRKAYDLNTVGINLDEGALRVLRYRVTSRLRLEAIHRDYIPGLVDDDEDDFDPTDCFIRLIANWGE